jgi:hypothetical protein
MKITAETIHNVNAALAASGSAEAAEDVWLPIAEALIDTHCPEHRYAEAEALGGDYVGATQDGYLVAWGQEHPIPGTGTSYREFALI